MSTKKGEATVVTSDVVIPVAYDGECSSEPVPEPTVEAALKSFNWKPGYVGFRFAEAAKVKVTLDDGEEMTFKRESRDPKTYYFAKRVIDINDFNTAAEFKGEPYDTFRRMASWALEDTSNLLFESERGLKVFQASEKNDTVLINREGQQLWPSKPLNLRLKKPGA